MAIYKGGDALSPKKSKKVKKEYPDGSQCSITPGGLTPMENIADEYLPKPPLGLTPSLLPRKHPKPQPGEPTTFEYRDPEKRREYMREYQKKRRAKKAAERKM